MVGKAWRLARTRRRRAAWAAEAVSVVWLAAVIAPATGGANWLTSPMMVLRQALAPCSSRPLHCRPCHFRTAWIHAGPSRRPHAEGACGCGRVGGGPRVQEAEDRQGSRFGRCFIGMRARTWSPLTIGSRQSYSGPPGGPWLARSPTNPILS